MMRGYMITGFILLLLGLSLANAGEQTRIYDAHGRNIGTAVPQGEGASERLRSPVVDDQLEPRCPNQSPRM